MLKYVLLAIASAGLTLAATPWVRAAALRLGAADRPGGRRMHQGCVPRLGGVAIWIALVGAVALGVSTDPFFLSVFFDHNWSCLLAGATVVAMVGAADDLWNLGPASKLSFQILAGILALLGGYGISSITNPFTGGSIALGWLMVPATLLWVIGITNAFNLIDGLDGLATGVGLIASATLFVVSLAAGRIDIALLSVALLGALAGFLYFNFNPASIFLGDSGSLLLGYLLSILSIGSAQKGATAVVILVPILALGLPIMDTLLAVARRLLGALHVVQADRDRNQYRFFIRGSASVFAADRDHIHHRLLALGLTHRRAVLVLYGACVVLSLLAFLAVTVQGAHTALLVAVVGVATYVAIKKLGYQEVAVFKRGTLLPLFELPMFNRRLVHAAADAGFLTLAYALSFLLAHGPELSAASRDYLLHSVVVVVAIKLVVLLHSGLYRRTYRYTDAGDLVALVKGLLAAHMVAVGSLALGYGLPARAAALLLLDLYLSGTLIVGARISFKLLEVLAREPEQSRARPVLIYGADAGGTAVLGELLHNPKLRWRPVGFVDDLPTLWGREVNGLPVLGGVEHLADVIHRHRIREVIVASGKVEADQIKAAASACLACGIPLRRFRLTFEPLHRGARERVRTPAALHPVTAVGGSRR